jgi:hypothetical protein
MVHGFDFYRVFVSAPGDLVADREVCHRVIACVNEAISMPEKILLASIGLREDEHIVGYRAAVADNVRSSTYFVQIFQDDWGPRDLFRKLFLQAVEVLRDPAMPMRDLLICLKDAPGETDEQILAFRRELEDQSVVHLFRYKSLDEFEAQLEATLSEWALALVSLKESLPRIEA